MSEQSTGNRAGAGQVVEVRHPLVQHKLTLLRRTDTSTSDFRRLLREISMLLAYEVTRDAALEEVEIERFLDLVQRLPELEATELGGLTVTARPGLLLPGPKGLF